MADKLMRTMVVMIFFLGMALFSSCATNGLRLSANDNGRQINLTTDDIVTLILDSNPTTGYSWQVVEIDNAVLKQNGEVEYKSDSQNIPGSGGTETFRFEAIGSGKSTLTLGYMRPWENEAPIETFTIQVIVQ